ncbi:uncharacterized protein LOC131162346 isoform X2 [Malania oleifera]|uniref:uncharacterized protein LOC131162346 isoform X2 n=2 Tax=Malania oleifera TaxID=397392 RepID=UPI0025AE3BA6|nr:uncharacterized protein LOC131162346 isoform X2 [Malania oleifera]
MDLEETEDHWAFLEEIEAPMWIDLTLEAKSMNKEFDDEWFHTSHLFHQYSSCQLKYAFSHSSVGNSESDFDILGATSPGLPSSVSRSRGKNYRSQNWGAKNCDPPLDKKHPIKNLRSNKSWLVSGRCEVRRLKSSSGNSKGVCSSKSSLVCESRIQNLGAKNCDPPLNKKHPIKTSSSKKPWVDSGKNEIGKSSSGNSKGACSSKSSLVCESSLSGAIISNCTRHICSFGDLKANSSSAAVTASESNSASTVTSEHSLQHHQKFLEVSSRSFDHKNGLLSALKISLRKSCVTRQAARVEIEDNRQSKGRKSSSGKSSVGSCSSLGYDVKNMAFKRTLNKERISGNSNAMRISQAAKNKVKVSGLSKASTNQVEDRISNSRRGSKTIVTKFTHKEAAKSKVLHQAVYRRALVLHEFNKQDPLTAATKEKEKGAVGRSNRLSCSGKENALGKMAVIQKSCNKDASAVGKVWCQRVTKQSVVQKSGKTGTGLIGSKGKINGEWKEPMNACKKTYLR